MYLSRHAQWSEILGGKQVIWVLDTYGLYYSYLVCTFRSNSKFGAQERALLFMMQVLNLGHSTQIIHVKQACRQQPLAL